MTLEITVRGSAERRYPAERATVVMAAAIEGFDKSQVFKEAVSVQEPLTAQLKELVTLDAVSTWSSDQVRVYSHRPWAADGRSDEVVHVARVQVLVEFTDFERLSAFLDHWTGTEGVEIGGIAWDVTAKNRRAYESSARKSAVDDAVAKAQAYADALRRGRVTAQKIADPGMLGTAGDGAAAGPGAYVPAAAELSGSRPDLELAPEEIVIRVDVDARFRAD